MLLLLLLLRDETVHWQFHVFFLVDSDVFGSHFGAIMSTDRDPYVTMSIASFGPSTLQNGRLPSKYAVKCTNLVSDIDGAQSTKKCDKFLNKTPFLQSDVHGSVSKTLSRGRNVQDNTLYIDDIEGSRHTIKDRMMRTNRHVDPLKPDYCLPTSAQDEIPSLRFIKDPQHHKDIDGSCVKQKLIFSTRDTMNVGDIEGAQANWKPYHR